MRSGVFWSAAICLLCLMGAAQTRSAHLECQTFDEASHLSGGYSYLRAGDFRMATDHPPFANMLTALPLLWLKPGLPLAGEAWATGNFWDFGTAFLYANRVPADRILAWSRSVTIAVTIALGLLLAWWTRRTFGPGVALLATFLFAFDPNLIAHGRYVTADMIATALIFASTLALARFIRTNRRRDGALAGACCGLAVASKFSALFLFPVFVILYLLRWWQEGGGPAGRRSLARLAQSAALIGVASAVIIGAVYASETMRLFRGELPPLARVMNRPSLHGTLAYSIAGAAHLPAHMFFRALLDLADHDKRGNEAYLLGRVSQTGWWYYFPVAFLVKTPSAVLLLCAIAACAALADLYFPPLAVTLKQWRAARFEWLVVAITPAFYFLLSMLSSINLGVRHILPVYPFLFILLAAVLFRLRTLRLGRAFPIILAGVIAVEAAESAWIYPDYLAFFNTLSGGPGAGHEYLLDSNIDWGQDLKKLKDYLDRRRISSVCLAYFGRAIPAYYGIHAAPLPMNPGLRARDTTDCVAVVSVTFLYGLYIPREAFGWLRELEPDARIGYTLYVYDLRKRKP